MEMIYGYIKHIIFSNKENGYTVFELATDTEEITCVGSLHAAGEGETLKLFGEYVNHNVYGRQFAFSRYEMCAADDETAILRYLSSGAVKGIGPATAKKIVEAFGEDTFRVMEEEPEMLSVIKGISARKAQEIGASFSDKRELRRVMIFLQGFGISNNLANRIYGRYGIETYRIMEENPYRLAEDIEGVGFRTADEIALMSGVDRHSPYRIRSGIVYTVSAAVSEGHIYLPLEEMQKRATAILDVSDTDILSECKTLAMEGKLILRSVNGQDRVYLPRYYKMELACARMLTDLDITVDSDTGRIREAISRLEDKDIPLDDKQRDAVVAAASNGVSIITGGPGTGKTTIINVLIKYLVSCGDEFLLAAPTGRAAKRMTEATGYVSSTIQRMLGLSPQGSDSGTFSYEYNEDNPLDVDAIIIDEMSMVDLPLFRALLSAIVPGTRLIMVGDVDQLPSVGPGSVLSDILSSGMFESVRLDRIFRQSDEGDIIVYAHEINAGTVPKLDNKSRDFFMLQRDNVDLILNNIVLLVSEKLPRYVGARPFDIQVLTPTRKGRLGVESLNPILQKYINPPSPSKNETETGGTVFREGDKVMQIRNNYQIGWEVTGRYNIAVEKGQGIFNGDMGIIERIDDVSETLEVVYEEDRRVRYEFSELDDLELAYAVTVHKSQGSEYPAVVIPLLGGPKQLLNRNILYTAVTRAQKCVTIVGSMETVTTMVENADGLRRYTSLDEAIKEISLL